MSMIYDLTTKLKRLIVVYGELYFYSVYHVWQELSNYSKDKLSLVSTRVLNTVKQPVSQRYAFMSFEVERKRMAPRHLESRHSA